MRTDGIFTVDTMGGFCLSQRLNVARIMSRRDRLHGSRLGALPWVLFCVLLSEGGWCRGWWSRGAG